MRGASCWVAVARRPAQAQAGCATSALQARQAAGLWLSKAQPCGHSREGVCRSGRLGRLASSDGRRASHACLIPALESLEGFLSSRRHEPEYG